MNDNSKLKGWRICKFHLLFTSWPLPMEKSCMFSQLTLMFCVLSSICGHRLPSRIEKHRSWNRFPWNSCGYSIHCKNWPSGPHHYFLSFYQGFIHGRKSDLTPVWLNFFKRLWGMHFCNSVGCHAASCSGHFFHLSCIRFVKCNYFANALMTLPHYIIFTRLFPNCFSLSGTTLFSINIKLTGLYFSCLG